VPAADAAALADALLQTAPHDLMEFGLAGLAVARNATHEKLHDDRLIALNRLFAISQ
jgi:glycine cleavage system aminomethyltransferase T